MNRLRECREAKNLSQKQVAIIIKVSASIVSQWESGSKNVSTANLRKLSELYEVPIDYLINHRSSDIEKTEGEERLLNIYRQLNQTGRQLLMDSASSYLAQPALRQEGSMSSAE